MMLRNLLLFLALYVASSHCVCPDDVMFVEHPEDSMVTVGDRNIRFHCRVVGSIRSHQWEHYLPSGSRVTINRNMSDKSFFIDGQNGDLLIGTVDASHGGAYGCVLLEANNCVYFSNNATLTVQGPPQISLPSSQYPVNTQENLQISGTIEGFPAPSVQLFRGETEITASTHLRFSVMFESTVLRIIIDTAQVKDGGVYTIKAMNMHGNDTRDFTITTMGPDPPSITVTTTVVAHYDQPVMVNCSVQETALIDTVLEVKWMNPQMNEISSNSGEVFVMSAIGNSVLKISALTSNHTGSYMCMANNTRGNDVGVTTIYGPPSRITALVINLNDGGEHIITWDVPLRGPPVFKYMVYIYRTGESVPILNMSVEETSYTVPAQLDPGEYDVAIAAVGGTEETPVEGKIGELGHFEISSVQGVPTTVIAAVAGSVGGVVVLVLVGVAIGVFFLCIYYPRKRQLNSQQQRWSSEEEKVDGTISNTYTALTLNPHSELPPSPNSPMISSIFSTEIDPKWEFPRENVQLSDVLNEGQFTVLYKGYAKGIKEKPLDVAVKSVKVDATEDDIKALICEMELLSSIGPHPHIVSLVRVCTVGKPIYMVMEYMCHGDLLGFMRASRGHHGLYTVSPGTRYQPPSLTLSSRDLLNIASKIAKGMRFLADRKIVHRALCCKNVLVGAGMEIKIYNVGSFDITFDNRDSLMKWMAPETLFDGTTTTYSDVWSFGVTLWELVTVGGTPYAEIQVEDLYSQLHTGMRMPRPQHCAQEVYDIMRDCWERNPTDRPHLSVIHDQLDGLAASKMSFLNLRDYNGYEYSQFEDPIELSTAL